jgi:hypothetical protein
MMMDLTELEGIDSTELRVVSDEEIAFVSGGINTTPADDESRRGPRIAFWVDGLPVYRLV